MVMISKLLSLHANHFMWFIAINPHNNLIKWVELSLLSYKKWGLSLKEVKYLAHSHASLAGAEPRKFDGYRGDLSRGQKENPSHQRERIKIKEA